MEAMVHFNGPLLHEADGILKAALDMYFRDRDLALGTWHFHRTSRGSLDGHFSVTSKVQQRLNAERS